MSLFYINEILYFDFPKDELKNAIALLNTTYNELSYGVYQANISNDKQNDYIIRYTKEDPFYFNSFHCIVSLATSFIDS